MFLFQFAPPVKTLLQCLLGKSGFKMVTVIQSFSQYRWDKTKVFVSDNNFCKKLKIVYYEHTYIR